MWLIIRPLEFRVFVVTVTGCISRPQESNVVPTDKPFFLLFVFVFLIPVFPFVFVPDILGVVFINTMKIGASLARSHLIRSVSAGHLSSETRQSERQNPIYPLL